jgi:putative hemin transport protein
MQSVAKKIEFNETYIKYTELKKQNPKLREREAAKQLEITEAQLVASKVGIDAVLLEARFFEILSDVHKLGEVMALTRNNDVVHERKGIYNHVSIAEPKSHNIGLVVNPDIDLRIFFNTWQFAFAVNENDRRSFQFFAKDGEAVHKIYLTENSNRGEYYNLIEKYAAADQSDVITVGPKAQKNPEEPDSKIDLPGLRSGWESLKDTHDFYMLLRRYKVEREQAFRMIGKDLAYQAATNSLRQVLESARDKKCEIMVFVGNPGCLQIHTGPVENLAVYGPWFNVLDPMFNLHVNEAAINTAWVVKKPSVDGTIHSVEFFDKTGELILTFFGKRKPGIPELELWREIVAEIKPL